MSVTFYWKHTYKADDMFARNPSPSMTDQEWQEYFNFLRANIKPSESKMMNRPNGRAKYLNSILTEQYSGFINDMLKGLRSGKKDYCYYIYQVTDLLRFEHDRLRSEYLPAYKCIKVWLAK